MGLRFCKSNNFHKRKQKQTSYIFTNTYERYPYHINHYCLFPPSNSIVFEYLYYIVYTLYTKHSVCRALKNTTIIFCFAFAKNGMKSFASREIDFGFSFVQNVYVAERHLFIKVRRFSSYVSLQLVCRSFTSNKTATKCENQSSKSEYANKIAIFLRIRDWSFL